MQRPGSPEKREAASMQPHSPQFKERKLQGCQAAQTAHDVKPKCCRGSRTAGRGGGDVQAFRGRLRLTAQTDNCKFSEVAYCRVRTCSVQPVAGEIISDRRSTLQTAAAIGDPARCSDREEGGTDTASGDEVSLSGSLSEIETVTSLVVTPQTADDIV
ncbi:hypothetical protein NDU88_003050 [Pleurodeles waltl]|uniref:Uncharacterized protein n=1 Tax=Pleurodeles waltl TaxID=8319 RepID=A0AAV7KUJ5_PLEWA|nr:hypothetical protein NDU88_003050 [Pleurodeles waltl]